MIFNMILRIPWKVADSGDFQQELEDSMEHFGFLLIFNKIWRTPWKIVDAL